MYQPQQTTITNNDILTALAGILFFGYFIKSSSPFVEGYTKVGTLNFIFFVITVCLFLINSAVYTVFLHWLANIIAIGICLMSAFCITACLNEIALVEILPALGPYPTVKDLVLRPYILCKNLLFRILNQGKSSLQ